MENLNEILKKPELEKGLQTYIHLMNSLHTTNIVDNTNFQNQYAAFYGMKRFCTQDFLAKYFEIMEQLKNSDAIDFEMVFTKVVSIQGTYEISFASKLLHTINPKYPIWDRVVTKEHFGITAPYCNAKNRLKACCQRYRLYTEKFYEYMRSNECIDAIRQFDEIFPNKITDVKKIDFILWQDRGK